VTKTPGYQSPERVRRSTDVRLIVVLVALALIGGWFFLNSTQGSTPSVLSPGVTGTSTRAATAASPKPPASEKTDPVSGLRWVALTALPAQAADTIREIKAGPPYAYPSNDGVVYHNAEGVLPKQPDGYYHEFTVVTPGASTRGARRIIAGGPKMGQTKSEWYYTGDHYSTFERIRP
jgi:ribonuclease T1